MSGEAIQPCPFCGYNGHWEGKGAWRVVCTNVTCGAKGPSALYEAQAVIGWNHREPTPSQGLDANEESCARCGATGEIVTNWDTYMDPPEGAPSEAGAADCPDCDGRGVVTPGLDAATVEREGEWRPIEIEALRKGFRRSPKYYPAIGETCRMSGPNCDNDQGYTWADVEVLWRDDLFIVTRTPGCWPTVTKLELALFEPALATDPHQHGEKQG